jgi:homoisocitrate dehydrogenase
MKLCVIPGDGIGIEVIDAAVQVLQVLAPEIERTTASAGWQTFQQTGKALPDETLAAATAADAVLFGAVASPSHPVLGYRSPIVELRRALDLYANLRPVTGWKLGAREHQSPAAVVDLVVVRENTEGLYAGLERLEDDGKTAIAERVITQQGSERIIRQAFQLAQERAAAREREKMRVPRLPKVTVVHKANVLRLTDGLFREVAFELAKEYPEIALEELLVDVAAMHIAQHPTRFDVVVTTNLYGDILSDVACIHGGGLGLASSANLGLQYALFEPVHGAAPDIAGSGTANPLAMLRCVALLLEWAERRGHITQQRSQALRIAVARAQHHGPHTPDLGGNATTGEVLEAVIEHLQDVRDLASDA